MTTITYKSEDVAACREVHYVFERGKWGFGVNHIIDAILWLKLPEFVYRYTVCNDSNSQVI